MARQGGSTGGEKETYNVKRERGVNGGKSEGGVVHGCSIRSARRMGRAIGERARNAQQVREGEGEGE